MINTGPFTGCVCKRLHNPHPLCDGKLGFEENGIKVRLIPRSGEQAVALVVDGCMFKGGQKRCDGLFILSKGNRKWIILVELKASNLSDAFNQLANTKISTKYNEIYDLISEQRKFHPVEMTFIVSNYALTKTEHQKLENSNRIRVKSLLHSEATLPIPDIRELII